MSSTARTALESARVDGIARGRAARMAEDEGAADFFDAIENLVSRWSTSGTNNMVRCRLHWTVDNIADTGKHSAVLENPKFKFRRQPLSYQTRLLDGQYLRAQRARYHLPMQIFEQNSAPCPGTKL